MDKLPPEGDSALNPTERGGPVSPTRKRGKRSRKPDARPRRSRQTWREWPPPRRGNYFPRLRFGLTIPTRLVGISQEPQRRHSALNPTERGGPVSPKRKRGEAVT